LEDTGTPAKLTGEAEIMTGNLEKSAEIDSRTGKRG
jgi:hypothetical protein